VSDLFLVDCLPLVVKLQFKLRTPHPKDLKPVDLRNELGRTLWNQLWICLQEVWLVWLELPLGIYEGNLFQSKLRLYPITFIMEYRHLSTWDSILWLWTLTILHWLQWVVHFVFHRGPWDNSQRIPTYIFLSSLPTREEKGWTSHELTHRDP
jgi:hypothetical protein